MEPRYLENDKCAEETILCYAAEGFLQNFAIVFITQFDLGYNIL